MKINAKFRDHYPIRTVKQEVKWRLGLDRACVLRRYRRNLCIELPAGNFAAGRPLRSDYVSVVTASEA